MEDGLIEESVGLFATISTKTSCSFLQKFISLLKMDFQVKYSLQIGYKLSTMLRGLLGHVSLLMLLSK